MGRNIYKIGEKYGNLTLIEKVRIRNHTWLVFMCDCGNTIKIRDDKLIKRKDKSCGCVRKTRRRLKNIYYGIISRTTNPKISCYKNYGGRGIKVCEDWIHNFNSFYNWAIKNGYRDDLTIDRIDNDGNYCPENCRWITHKEQQRNKRNNKIVSFNGETRCLTEWAELLGTTYQNLSTRIRLGYTVEQALLFPRSTHRKTILKQKKDY